jgi:nucleoside-diphosphate-sugar epimerase
MRDTVLVLGGTRFIGPYVVRLLAEQGHDVTVFHRGETEADLPASVRHIHGDFATIAEHVANLQPRAPEVVLDMVPFLDKVGHGALHFRGIARRAVVVTSSDVYRAFGRLWRTEPGPPEPVPLTEESPLRTNRAGDLARDIDYDNIEVERAVSSDPELPVTILRLPATHGPGDNQHRLFGYLKRMDDGRPAILLEERFARWRWVRGYVENVASAIALAVQDERAAGRIYNVCEPVAYAEAEWVRRIGDVVGWQGEVVAVPAELLPKSDYDLDFSQDYVVDSSRIRRELGYAEIVPDDEALQRTTAWERLNPPELGHQQLDYEQEDGILAALGL